MVCRELIGCNANPPAPRSVDNLFAPVTRVIPGSWPLRKKRIDPDRPRGRATLFLLPPEQTPKITLSLCMPAVECRDTSTADHVAAEAVSPAL
jgi:hypothetical protein